MRGSSGLARGAGQQNLERLFADMGLNDRSQILDKLHKIRMKEANKYGAEDPSKPQLLTNDKDRIREQYYLAKRQLNPDA